ncbi:hypothetical protein DPMN_153778 [Dreissena polymorpha]|uniref:Uncharacterized protein n=1 Tax=Dreissena polymorpha TaxID=45954 RepID=A0A9D4J6D7_DREPO|nr:hypothetical protein DPMN_153778 [Dreissena polymorpha]
MAHSSVPGVTSSSDMYTRRYPIVGPFMLYQSCRQRSMWDNGNRRGLTSSALSPVCREPLVSMYRYFPKTCERFYLYRYSYSGCRIT